MTDSDRGFSCMSEVNKNKNISSYPANVRGKKNTKGKTDRFSIKMAIFRGKKRQVREVNPACRRKKN